MQIWSDVLNRVVSETEIGRDVQLAVIPAVRNVACTFWLVEKAHPRPLTECLGR